MLGRDARELRERRYSVVENNRVSFPFGVCS